MPLFLQIIIFVLVLSFLVIIHELGHLLAAKWAKIKVEEFGIGYPPRAFKMFKWGKILFSMNWIPVGGFVKMVGEDGPEENETEEQKKHFEDEDGLAPFYKRSRKKRMVVILAGVVVNLIFGLLAFTVIFYAKGIPTPVTGARISYVAPNSPAQKSGMTSDTEIKEIAFGKEIKQITTAAEASDFIKAHRGNEVVVTTTEKCVDTKCPEQTKKFIVKLRTEAETPANEGSLGIGFTDFIYKFYPWYQMPFRSMAYGVEQALLMILMILVALAGMIGGLFHGVLPRDVAGPIGIIDQASQSGLFSEGFLAILNFAAMISINLGVMNLLPIPALDGGRALFIFLEKFFGKKRVSKIENYANYTGMILLLVLIVVITIADIGKIIRR